jgi:hypothetical protein
MTNEEVPARTVDELVKRGHPLVEVHIEGGNGKSSTDAALEKLVKAAQLQRKPTRIEKIFARLSLLIFVLVAILVLGTANVLATGEAVNTMNPGMFGGKLSRWIPMMANFHGWRAATLGHVFGAAFFMFTAFSWKVVANDIFLVDGNDLPENEFRTKIVSLFARIICGGLFCLDLVLFYTGSAAINRWAGGHSFSGLLITAVYGFIAASFALGYLILSYRVRRLNHES